MRALALYLRQRLPASSRCSQSATSTWIRSTGTRFSTVILLNTANEISMSGRKRQDARRWLQIRRWLVRRWQRGWLLQLTATAWRRTQAQNKSPEHDVLKEYEEADLSRRRRRRIDLLRVQMPRNTRHVFKARMLLDCNEAFIFENLRRARANPQLIDSTDDDGGHWHIRTHADQGDPDCTRRAGHGEDDYRALQITEGDRDGVRQGQEARPRAAGPIMR